MFVNNPIDDEDQKRKKKANFKGNPQDIEERIESDELNWTRLESLWIFLNVFFFFNDLQTETTWGAGSHINSGPYLQGQERNTRYFFISSFFSCIFLILVFLFFFLYFLSILFTPLGTNRSLTVKPNERGGLCMSMWTWHSVSQISPSIIHQSRPVGKEYADHFEAATWNGPAHAD